MDFSWDPKKAKENLTNLLLFVIHIYKENEETIHIISARKATSKERKDFDEL
jgi:uncharacterized DUF497 family protein